MQVRKKATFKDLTLHVCGYITNSALSPIIATTKEKDSVIDACDMLRKAFLTCRRQGRPKSERIAWIIPKKLLDPGAETIREEADIIDLVSNLCPYASYQDWLPWMSLELGRLAKVWRLQRINSLRRTVFKWAKEIDSKTESVYPWHPNFRQDIATTPIEVLYQFEPTDLTKKALREITNVGLHSVGHLKWLHPDAIDYAKNCYELLLALYRKLNFRTV